MHRPRKVIVIRHGDEPPDDRVFTYLTTRGYAPTVRCPYRGDALDPVDEDLAGAVVHGGPFPVYEEDQHPFLRDEHRLIARCLEDDLPLLGICQGAQSIAHVLGAPVGPPEHGLHEFGYYEVRPTADGSAFLPAPRWFTQAHFHTFGIPSGAVHLAASDTYPHQAFRYGSAYGLQFHAEMTIEGFRRWQSADWAAYGQPGAQTRAEQDALAAQHDAAQAAWFYGFMATLFPPLADAPSPLV